MESHDSVRQDLGVPPPEALAVEDEDRQLPPEDARILAVDYDAQDERHKEWKIVCQEAAEYSFKDWPMEGPLCTLHMLKQMQRSGGSPKAYCRYHGKVRAMTTSDCLAAH